jgi:hypothetical protein
VAAGSLGVAVLMAMAAMRLAKVGTGAETSPQ